MQKFDGLLINENNKATTGLWFTDGVNITFNKRGIGFLAIFRFLSDAISLGKQVLTLPIDSIIKVEYFKYRLNKNAIKLTTKDGEIKLTVNKYREFVNIINSRLNKS